MKRSLYYKARSVAKATMRFVENNFTFLMVMICCNMPILASRSDMLGMGTQLSYIIVVNALLVLLVSAIRHKKTRRITQAVVIGLSVVFFFADCYFSFYYQGVPDQPTLEVLFATTPAEAAGFIRANMVNPWIYVTFVAMLCTLYLVTRYVGRLRRYTAVVCILSAWIWFGVLLITANVIRAEWEGTRTPYNRFKYTSCALLRNCLLTSKAVKNLHALNRMRDGKKINPVILSNNSSIPYVIYILGESTSRHHMGMYGYHLDTTPFTAQREKQGSLIKFTDVISSEPITMKSLAKLFSFYRHGMPGEWYEQTDLFSVLKAAGYHTTWISNQEFSGKNGNNARIYAERCNDYAFTTYRSSSNYTLCEPYDEAVLPLLNKTLQTPHKKNFIVLHLMGAHQLYSQRFPETRRKFTATQEHATDEKVAQIRADYDNAVRYNDSIVSTIIDRFENKNAIIIYTPDHGEDVLEINKKAAGHNDINPNRLMVEIPMMVWMSGKFREAYPALASRVGRAAHRPFATDDMIHALLDLMQIQTAEYRDSLSIFSDHYNAGRIRRFSNKIYRPAAK